MILRLFRRKSRKTEDGRESKQEKTSKGDGGGNLTNPTTTSSNVGKSVSKTVALAELVAVLANPFQLLKLIRKSPILYVGYVRNDTELKSVVEKCGNKLLLLSIRSSGSLTHVIYFDGKFYTLVNGCVKVVDKLIPSNNNARIVIYKLE